MNLTAKDSHDADFLGRIARVPGAILPLRQSPPKEPVAHSATSRLVLKLTGLSSQILRNLVKETPAKRSP